MFKTKLVARSHNSILVRCECGCHFMEIYAFDDVWGVDWWSNSKYKYPDVQFESLDEWYTFIHYLALLVETNFVTDSVFVSNQKVHFKNGRVKNNGSFVISVNEFGYVDFIRYADNEKKKQMWDLSLSRNQLIELHQYVQELTKELEGAF